MWVARVSRARLRAIFARRGAGAVGTDEARGQASRLVVGARGSGARRLAGEVVGDGGGAGDSPRRRGHLGPEVSSSNEKMRPPATMPTPVASTPASIDR